ncbi:MAG: hypothetical protein ABEH38_04565 [Flavobacteriales bacterium]
MEFPVYRKYPNEKHFFRIRSETSFDELFIMGSRFGWREKEAEKHPDLLLIQDMLAMKDGTWLASSREEFEDKLEECRRERKPLQSS